MAAARGLRGTSEAPLTATTETVVLRGELDFATAFEVEMRLEEALGRADRVIVDLSGLDFIDSTGLGAILEASRAARRDGKELQLVPGPPAVQQVFSVSGLLEELRFVER